MHPHRDRDTKPHHGTTDAVLSPADGDTRRAVIVVRLSTMEDLDRLPPPRLAHATVRVEIALPQLTNAQRRHFEPRLAKQLAACGCREGHIGLLVYVAAVALL